jgi:hypothetical protein
MFFMNAIVYLFKLGAFAAAGSRSGQSLQELSLLR